MKKIIVFLLLVSAQLSAQFTPKASFDYFVGGYGIRTTDKLTARSSTVSYGNFRIRVGAEYAIKKLSAYFDQNVYANKGADISFSPIQAEWFVGVKFSLTKKINFKYEHLCTHPILSDWNPIENRLYGGYDMISVSYGY